MSPASAAMYVVSTGWRIMIIIETSVPQSSMFRSSGMRQIFGEAALSPLSACRFRSAIACTDAGGSLMRKTNIRKFRKSAPAARKNDIRMPNAVASTPPNKGPTTPPAVMTPCMMPRQRPSFFGGA